MWKKLCLMVMTLLSLHINSSRYPGSRFKRISTNKSLFMCVRCVRPDWNKKKLNIFKKLVHSTSSCNSHTVGSQLAHLFTCGWNRTFFQQLKLIWISNSGSAVLWTDFFSVKNSTPRGGGGCYSLHDPFIPNAQVTQDVYKQKSVRTKKQTERRNAIVYYI